MRYDVEVFTEKVEIQLKAGRQEVPSFASFLEDRMDQNDYSNTSLAKKVYHRVERGGESRYLPVTRQAIGAWLKGSMPSSREIYITLGMAFHMSLDEINHILLETYMGYGLYCKNIDDTLWIALINGLFTLDQMEEVRREIDAIIEEPSKEESASLLTTDLWVMLQEVTSLEQLYRLIRQYRDEFAGGARRFGQCLDEVIEAEYGYYEKAKWFLRDIGCLHYEAQFSKIRAGKAMVTREWLLRFLIALQPGYDSIEKLLAKAQMAPLGMTPAEVILEIISKEYTSGMSNSQEIWMLLESSSALLRNRGYDIPDDLCRKYNTAYELGAGQKWWMSVSVIHQILTCENHRDYGYEKEGYCRYCCVDRVLFDELNRMKKAADFKKTAALWEEGKLCGEGDIIYPELAELSVNRKEKSDILEQEKFAAYCLERRPSRFSRAFTRNDEYYCVALLYSLWTGKCFQKEQCAEETAELRLVWLSVFEDSEELANTCERILMGEGPGEEKKSELRELLDSMLRVKMKKAEI